MSLRKLSELTEAISPEEYRKLGDFVKSPYFNKSKRIIRVYSFLKKYSKDGSTELSKKALWEYVFPGEQYDDQKIRSLCSDMNRVLEKFLFHSSCNIGKPYEISIIFEELRLRGAFKSFEMLYKQLSSKRCCETFKHDYSHFQKIESSYGMYLSNKMKVNLRGQFRKMLQEVDYGFILSKLHSNNLIIIGESPLPENFKNEDFLFSEIVSYVEKHMPLIKKEHKAVYLEYLIYNLITDFKNVSSFNKIMAFLKENYSSLDIVHLTHAYYALNSQYISVSNYSIDEKYICNSFECSKLFVAKGFFDDYKLIPGTIFHNIIDTSLKVNKIKFAEFFFKKYSLKIDSEISGDLLLLTKAKILLYRKQYGDAVTALSKISMINYQVYLIAKSFLSRIYYELNDIESAYYVIDAAKHYLSRNKKTMGLRYISFVNFFNFLKKILGDNKDVSDIAKLITELEKIENVNGKSWLLEKLNEKLSVTSKNIRFYQTTKTAK